jgi:hypothetical protein
MSLGLSRLWSGIAALAISLTSLGVAGADNATAAEGSETRIVLSNSVTLIISTSVQCDAVKPGALFACEISAKAEAPWIGGGEFKVFDDTGVKRGFLSVFSDPNPDGTRKAQISLWSVPESGLIKIASTETLISVRRPVILEVKKFSFANYKWSSSVKSHEAMRVYATNLWGQRTDVSSLLVGVPTSVSVGGKSRCVTVKLPVAYLDKNGEAIFPRSSSLGKYLELRLSTWDGNALVSKLEYGQGKIPWSTGEVTEFPIEICGVPTKVGSSKTVELEAWAAFNLIGDGSYYDRTKIVVTRSSGTEATASKGDVSKVTFTTKGLKKKWSVTVKNAKGMTVTVMTMRTIKGSVQIRYYKTVAKSNAYTVTKAANSGENVPLSIKVDAEWITNYTTIKIK